MLPAYEVTLSNGIQTTCRGGIELDSAIQQAQNMGYTNEEISIKVVTTATANPTEQPWGWWAQSTLRSWRSS